MMTLKQFKTAYPLEPFSLFHAFCTLVLILSIYTFALWHPSSQLSWLLFSSLLISQAGLIAESSWHSLWQVLFYPCLGLLAGLTVLSLSLCAGNFFCSSLLVLLITGITSYLAWLKRQFFAAAFVINILGIITAFFPASLEIAEQRFYLIVFGSVLVFILRCLFWFFRRRWEFYFARVRYFQKLKYVYQLIFYTSGSAPGMFGQDLEESHFQVAWSDCLNAMQELKNILAKRPTSQLLVAHLERIWDISLSLGSLRYRLTEDAMFKMAHDEMDDLSQAIIAVLTKLTYSQKSWRSLALSAFQRAIQDFEELYHSMLQSVAKEPLVILLFIQDLYALKEELEKLPEALHQMQKEKRAQT